METLPDVKCNPLDDINDGTQARKSSAASENAKAVVDAQAQNIGYIKARRILATADKKIFLNKGYQIKHLYHVGHSGDYIVWDKEKFTDFVASIAI